MQPERQRPGATAVARGTLLAALIAAAPAAGSPPGDAPPPVAAPHSAASAGVLAAAQDACRQPPAPAETIPEVPWAQEWFAPERSWQHSQGDGVLVAVVDSGVDERHPQLSGRVRPGRDLVEEGGTDGRVDCHSHGTAVASLIAAAPEDGVGFRGLAPGAEILPVRVAEQNADPTDPEGESPVAASTFAAALRWAADQGARIINVSVAFYHDHPAVADAVEYVQEQGVLVVASVGQLRADQPPHPTPYPAAYPGVLGVGAINHQGAVGAGTALGPYVDLLAPGEAVTAAAARSGHLEWTGTSFAAPFVSAAAALVWAAEPELSASEVAARLRATADPGPGGPGQTGHGVVNPYRALVERVGAGEPRAAAPPTAAAVDPAAQARAERWEQMGRAATLVAATVLVLGVLTVAGRAVLRRGARTRWRPLTQADRDAQADRAGGQ